MYGVGYSPPIEQSLASRQWRVGRIGSWRAGQCISDSPSIWRGKPYWYEVVVADHVDEVAVCQDVARSAICEAPVS